MKKITQPKTTYWLCDSCGDLITSVADGWVEWLEPMPKRGQAAKGYRHKQGLRLVHHASTAHECQYDPGSLLQEGLSLADSPLSQYVGHDGLTRLLEFLSVQEGPPEQILEMIKRLHTPGYEEARLHFKEAIAEGVFEPNTLPGYYTQAEIAATLEFAMDR